MDQKELNELLAAVRDVLPDLEYYVSHTSESGPDARLARLRKAYTDALVGTINRRK